LFGSYLGDFDLAKHFVIGEMTWFSILHEDVGHPETNPIPVDTGLKDFTNWSCVIVLP
jgi:hypothetical protein